MGVDKQHIRDKYKKLRAGLSDEELAQKSLQITYRVKDFISSHPELSHYHLFFPIAKQREIDTYPIKDFLDSKGASVYTSRVSAHVIQMDTLKLNPATRFEVDSWGIPLPLDFELVDSSDIQVVFVPLLAFDGSGNRIGFGKGYYDSFLSQLNPFVLKVGLSVFPPENHISSGPHDIPLDYCITPENILIF